MRKPAGISTRQYVSAVHVLNNMIGQLPPAFEANQEILEPDLMDILVSNAPKTHRQLMVEHGFNPQTATTEEFVEICERAENKDALQTNRKRSDDDSSEDERPTKKITKKNRTSDYVTSKRSPFYCKVHGPNSTHNSKDCKVSLETEKNPMTGRRKTLPTVRTIKRSKRRNIANLTCYNSRLKERKQSGRKPTRSLRNPLGLIHPIQPATAKCPNMQTPSAPDEKRIFSKTAALTPAADLHPTPTPNRRTALGRTNIC